MAKNCILLSGPTIAHDEKLKEEFEKFAVVLTSDDNSQIESILRKNKIALIILEFACINAHEIEVISNVKNRFPTTEIILIDGDGDQEVIAQAFAFGAKDAFRKPYMSAMISERAKALLSKNSIHGSALAKEITSS